MTEQSRKKEPEWDKLSITNDFMFFTLMKDEKICKEIIERCLSIKIKKINYIEPQKSIDVMHDAKSVRLDIYVEDSDTVYDIEMQVSAERDLRKRTRFYQSIIDMNNLGVGEYYGDLKESIIIFICTFDLFKYALPRYTFKNICEEEPEISLDDGTKKIFLNAKAFAKAKDTKLKNLLAFVYGKEVENDNFIDDLSKSIGEIRNNKEWRTQFMTFNLHEQDVMNDAKFAEKLSIARNLLDVLDDATIALKTGISIEQVQELRQEALSMAE